MLGAGVPTKERQREHVSPHRIRGAICVRAENHGSLHQNVVGLHSKSTDGWRCRRSRIMHTVCPRVGDPSLTKLKRKLNLFLHRLLASGGLPVSMIRRNSRGRMTPLWCTHEGGHCREQTVVPLFKILEFKERSRFFWSRLEKRNATSGIAITRLRESRGSLWRIMKPCSLQHRHNILWLRHSLNVLDLLEDQLEREVVNAMESLAVKLK